MLPLWMSLTLRPGQTREGPLGRCLASFWVQEASRKGVNVPCNLEQVVIRERGDARGRVAQTVAFNVLLRSAREREVRV